MRKITQDAVQAFYSNKKFKSQIMSVKVSAICTTLELYGDIIAYKYNDPEQTLSITTCGWNTRVTKDCLNSLECVQVQIKKGQWYLNNKPWDGELVDVEMNKLFKIETYEIQGKLTECEEQDDE